MQLIFPIGSQVILDGNPTLMTVNTSDESKPAPIQLAVASKILGLKVKSVTFSSVIGA